jgi:predicted RNA-binding Zn ribbon-like protein
MDELCIRFVNTVSWRLRGAGEERLATPEAVLRWLADNDLASGNHVAHVVSSWRRSQDAAAAFHAEAIALREAIYGVFQARIEGAAPSADQLGLLNEWLARPMQGVELTLAGGGISWRPSSSGVPPGDLLRPIALSAAELITGPRAARVRQCADSGGCGWLFVDESRAQTRRWCSMGDCGNRAKAARHRARQRKDRHASLSAGAPLSAHGPGSPADE